MSTCRILAVLGIMGGLFGCAWAQNYPLLSPAGGATNLPDISVIGDLKGLWSDRDELGHDETFENTLALDEVEVVISDDIYPGLRGDLVLAAHGPDFGVEVEEAYLTADQIVPRAPLGARVGILRLPFGKLNPQHPHQWPFADIPAVNENFLGDHFIGNGLELVAVIPAPGDTFIQAELGRWNPRAHHHHHDEEEGEHHHELGAGFTDAFTLGRLWIAIPLGSCSELEVGSNIAVGNGVHEHEHEHEDEHLETALKDDEHDDHHHVEETDITLYGGDITWKLWLSGESRLMLQGQYIQRREEIGDETQRRDGYYGLATFRPNRQYEFGARYDWSELPGHESLDEHYYTIFGTRYLNETTFTRLQYKYGQDEHGEDVNEAWLQVVFGFGPHAHPLQ